MNRIRQTRGKYSPRSRGKSHLDSFTKSGLLAWYDTSSDIYLTLIGSAITQFLDRSGNGNDTAVQSTPTSRPTRVLDEINGLQSAVLDGGDELVLPSAIHALANSANTMFVVSSTSIDSTEQRLISLTESGSMRSGMEYISATDGLRYYNRTSYAGVAVSDVSKNTPSMFTGSYDGGTERFISTNGGTEATDSNGMLETGVDAGHLGSGGGSRHLTGRLVEVLFYDRILSDEEKLAVQIYLANKYGIYHPNATWLLSYTADQQSVIHAAKLNKDEAFQDVALNPFLAWYKSEEEYLTLVSTAITQKLDAGGRGNDTDVQGTPTARPTFNSTGNNGLGDSEYDGGDFFVLPSALHALPNGSYTVISVHKRTSEDATNDGIWGMTASTVLKSLCFYSATSGTVNFRSKNAGTTNVASTGNTNTDFQISHQRRDGTTTAIAINGETEITDLLATDVATIDNATLGTASSFALTGSETETFFLDVSAPASTILGLKTYLGDKYAITL